MFDTKSRERERPTDGKTALNDVKNTKWDSLNTKNLLEILQAFKHEQYQSYSLAMCFANRNDFAWLPIGIPEQEAKRFQAAFGSFTTNERLNLIIKTIPLSDVSASNFNHLPLCEKKSANHLFRLRCKNDMGIAVVEQEKARESNKACSECSAEISYRSYYYKILSKHNPSSTWCLHCFNCTECGNFLPDLIYFWHNQAPYCLRHYGEKFRPRCFSCDELIFSNEYTKAMKKNFHLDHFKCKQCQSCLTEEKYILKESDPFCLNCYDNHLAEECFRCKRRISCTEKGLSFRDRFWHDTCFVCNVCNCELSGAPFAMRDNVIFCAKCFEAQTAVRCDGCQEVLLPGARTFEYRKKRWHENCFACSKCSRYIGSDSFIPQSDDSPLCLKCYAKSILPMCNECKEPITSGGVTYKGGTWHSRCFRCGHCSKELAGKKFTIKNNISYCAECFGEYFAKKCFSCKKPISGFNGDQFVTFNENHYHSSCFQCHKCRSSLIKSGFISMNSEFFCPTCAVEEKNRIFRKSNNIRDPPNLKCRNYIK